ncbi:MAG: AAA family ATPase [Endomicrobium sp.]|jgi:cellulose biosynthesis protein BcsQ|nr:AAA family ATPase [Endomicrobium sp.]
MVKIISLFNHKGGVSKTTTTFNLGWSIALQGKKVLIVDADPQSNLTSLALSIPNEEAFENLYLRKDSNDIKSLVDHINSPAGMIIESSQSVSNIVKTSNPNLYILPGNLQIDEFSATITTALQLGNTTAFRAMRNIPVYLNFALRRIAEIHSIDYIIIDMAPSLSGLNEVLLMGSDYFISPCAPDFFSLIAIRNIAKIIPNWYEQIKSYQSDYPLACNPKFIGIIEQNYRPRRTNAEDNKNKPVKGFREWIDKIRVAANTELVPSLREKGLVVSEEKFKSAVKDLQPYDLAFISDFNSLIAFSQKCNKPVFELTQDDINRSGEVLRVMLDNVQKFKDSFNALAGNIIRLTE